MAIDIYNWIDLSLAVKKLKDAPAFLVKNVFTNRQLHPTETISWEEVSQSRKISKFKAKYGEPSNVESLSYKTKIETAPRIFERKTFRAEDLLGMSNAVQIVPANANDVLSTADQRILDELQALKYRVQTTWEWMCAKVLSTGKIVCKGDDIEYTYDFGFVDGVHKVNPSADWSGQQAKIVKDIREWQKKIYNRTGINPTMCLMGSQAADAFISNSDVQKALDTLNYRVGALDLNQAYKLSARFIGTFLGIDFYEYNWDVSGSEALGEKMVVMLAATNDFVMHFGAIYRMQEQTPKLYMEDMLVQTVSDKYGTTIEIAIESKPLPIPHNIDLIISSQVIA